MPTSTAPASSDLPPWATGSYPAGSATWSASPRQDAATIVASAAAGLIPNLRTRAQFFNAWLSRVQLWSVFARNELGSGIYGDASDGDVTLGAGTTTLTRDMYYDDLTVPNGATLAAAGFRIFVAGLLTVGATGVISNDGQSASGATQGLGTTAGTTGAGFQGGAGRVSSAGVGNAGTGATTALGEAGGTGGAGGANAGGAGGTATASPAGNGGWRHIAAALGRTADGTLWSGGTGGGGGGSDNGAANSGGGGGGGGVLIIFARRVSNAGTIRANGGSGGNSDAGVNLGGGAGGGGGAVFVVHREAVGGTLGTVTANGGAGGTGTTANGAAGSAGQVITSIG